MSLLTLIYCFIVLLICNGCSVRMNRWLRYFEAALFRFSLVNSFCASKCFLHSTEFCRLINFLHFPVHVPIHSRHFNFILSFIKPGYFCCYNSSSSTIFFLILFTKLWINVDQINTYFFCTNTTTHHRPYTIKIRINVKSINLHI